jgi:hypothetical protein
MNKWKRHRRDTRGWHQKNFVPDNFVPLKKVPLPLCAFVAELLLNFE